MIRSQVWCSFTFEGYHRWPDAPDKVFFLRQLHRHVFHVKAWKTVTHDDRDVEFIMLKWDLQQACQDLADTQDDEVSTWSCEHWARWLIEEHGLDRCEVSEDGENGALLEKVDSSAPQAKVVAVSAPAHVIVNLEGAFVCTCGLTFMDADAATDHAEDPEGEAE